MITNPYNKGGIEILNVYYGSSSATAHISSLARIVDVGYELRLQPFQTQPHSHEGVTELVFIQSGKGTVRCYGTKHLVSTGDLIIYEPGLLHYENWFSFQDPLIVLYLRFSKGDSPFEEDEFNTIQQHPVLNTGRYQSQISRLFWMINREWGNERLNQNEICNHLLASLLLLVRRMYSMKFSLLKTKTESIAQQVKSFLDTHTVTFSLKTLAERFHISVYHLSHVFKEEIGISPIRYANQKRMERAKLMLQTTTDSVQDIAAKIGYENTSSFYQMFRSFTGTTPAKYRQYVTALVERQMNKEEQP